MKLTIIILLLPVTLLFGTLLANHDFDTVALPDSLAVSFYFLWIASTLVCLVRGCFIFRHHRLLALCCFAIAMSQIVLALMPAAKR
jgi:hypothetical protein